MDESNENSQILSRFWSPEYRWLAYSLPLIVYMVAQTFEPSPPDELSRQGLQHGIPVAQDGWFAYESYPLVYVGKFVITAIAVVICWPILKEMRGSVSWRGLLVGVAGLFVWVGICELQWDVAALRLIGLDRLLGLGERAAFNPWEQIPDPQLRSLFLVFRFAGLTLLVPIIEEYFYRGLIMRMVMSDRWWEVSLSNMNWQAIAVGLAIPALAHPAELGAAVAWFGMVTVLMIWTGSLWECILAHGVTNLLLGLYVIYFEAWELW